MNSCDLLKEKISEKEFSEYMNCEEHYREYVYRHYLEVPVSVYNSIKNLFSDYNFDGLDEIKQGIISFLTQNMEYSTHSDEPLGDFALSFLQENRSGYSVHFATAAALMLRCFGIPARYVEGYIVTPFDAENTNFNQPVTLDETRAHAWAEYYCDGVGWMPFETTPPYIEIMNGSLDINDMIFEQNTVTETQALKHDSLMIGGNSNVYPQQSSEFDPFKTVIFIIVIFVLALALIVFVRRAILHRYLKNTFRSNDLPLAVNNLFAYSACLLCRIGVISQPEEIYDCHDNIADNCNEIYAGVYDAALSVYQKAKFGICDLTEKDRIIAEKFENMTEILYNESRKKR